MKFYLACLAIVSFWVLPASAHINGIPIIPKFASPEGIQETDGVSIQLRWVDGDQDPTGIIYFHYTPDNATPDLVPTMSLVTGEEIVSIPVSDDNNSFEWNLSDIEPGVYHTYARVVDPPFCDRVVFSNALTIHRGTSEQSIFGGIITYPRREGYVIDERGTIELLIVSSEVPSVSLEYGITTQDTESDPPDSDCSTIRTKWQSLGQIGSETTIEAIPELGNDYWRISAEWDSSQVVPGAYLIKATISNPDSLSRSLYSSGWISVIHDDTQPMPPPVNQAIQTPETQLQATPTPEKAPTSPKPSHSSPSCSVQTISNQPLAWLILILIYRKQHRLKT